MVVVVVRSGRTDSEEGERGWRGKTARLTPCWLVCLSRTPAQSGALAGRASSPPPLCLEPDSSRASTPAPAPNPQPTWVGRARVLDQGVCLSASPTPRKVGTLRAGGGAGAPSPSHSGTFASRTPALPLQPCCPYLPQEPRAKEQEKPFREQPHLPGRPSRGRAGRDPGRPEPGLGARGPGLARRGVAAGAAGAGGAARGLSKRSGSRRWGRGAGGGESWVGLERAGGRGSASLQSRPRPARPLPPSWGHRR